MFDFTSARFPVRALSAAAVLALAAGAAHAQKGETVKLAYIDALYDGQAQVISEQAQRDQELLSGYYTRWLQVTRALDEAQALRDQIAASGQNAAAEVPGSSALVLSLLKLQAFTQATDPQSPMQMDVTADPVSRVTAQASSDTSASAAPGLVQSTQPVQVQVGATPLQHVTEVQQRVGEGRLALQRLAVDGLGLGLALLGGQQRPQVELHHVAHRRVRRRRQPAFVQRHGGGGLTGLLQGPGLAQQVRHAQGRAGRAGGL